MRWQEFVELSEEPFLISPGVLAAQKFGISLGGELVPGITFVARQNRVEKGVDAVGGGVVAGGVANHEDLVAAVMGPFGLAEMFGFGAMFLAGDKGDVLGETVVAPLTGKGGDGGLGRDDEIGCLGHLGDSFAGPGKGRNGAHLFGDIAADF